MTNTSHRRSRVVSDLRVVDGKGAVRLEDRFDTDIDDLWAALTDPERLSRWLGVVAGDLRLNGEFSARFLSTGWEGTGRVQACERPRHLVVVTVDDETPEEQVIEATLTADGDATLLVIEERGMPLDQVAAYGAGVHVHLEDLAAHLAGGGRCDGPVRWQELFPAYQALDVTSADRKT